MQHCITNCCIKYTPKLNPLNSFIVSLCVFKNLLNVIKIAMLGKIAYNPWYVISKSILWSAFSNNKYNLVANAIKARLTTLKYILLSFSKSFSCNNNPKNIYKAYPPIGAVMDCRSKKYAITG